MQAPAALFTHGDGDLTVRFSSTALDCTERLLPQIFPCDSASLLQLSVFLLAHFSLLNIFFVRRPQAPLDGFILVCILAHMCEILLNKHELSRLYGRIYALRRISSHVLCFVVRQGNFTILGY